jgi:hypothetical protein
MQSRIVGTTMPVLEALLQPGESLISEAGELSWMTQTISMGTHTQMAGGGGFFGAIKRVAGGGTLFMTEYTAQGFPGEVAFAAKVPGHILPLEIMPGQEYFIHRHGFLCATPQINLGVGFQQSLGAGIFGGDGFLLQKVTGTGTAWRNPACASRPRGRVPRLGELSDHAHSRDTQHDLRRRWHLSRRADRPGPRVAANASAGKPGACALAVSRRRRPKHRARDWNGGGDRRHRGIDLR